MHALTLAILIAIAAAPAIAQDSKKPIADKPVAEKKAFKPPPGYKTRHRGDETIYCRKGAEIGSRFPVETCYDEAQLKEFIARTEQEKRSIEQTLRVCSNPATCVVQ
jgi:hypothetical protein